MATFRGVLLFAWGLSVVAGGLVSPDWMGDAFEMLRDKLLLEVTLPGSHNSGNYEGGLHADVLCQSDYRYSEYLASPSSLAMLAKGKPLFTRAEFDSRMIPWNINHFKPIKEQLLGNGVRYLHLKICDFGEPGDPMDLAAVRFQHRGYTTRETVLSTLQDVLQFLKEHPKEIVLLAFNNLHKNASKVFDQADVDALSAALESELGEMMMDAQDLFSKRIGELVDAGKRIAVFVKGARENRRVIPSEANLAENWAPVMASGNLSAARDWLRQDLSLRAASAQHARYYVMQANPNNAEALMYEAMNSRLGPQSNLRFLQHFLKGIGILVLAAEARDHQLQINVIDTDFLSISQPYGICMRLLELSSSSFRRSSSDLLYWGLCALFVGLVCASLLLCTYCKYRKPKGYQHQLF